MPPQRRYRKTNMDHVADALLHLQEVEKALERMEVDKLNTRGREQLAALQACIKQSKLSCADTIDAVLGRIPERPEQPEQEPPAAAAKVTRPRRPRAPRSDGAGQAASS